MKKILIVVALISILLASAMSANAVEMKYRLVYMSHSMTNDANVPVVQDIMRHAKAAGYNGVIFSEYHFEQLDLMNAKYFRNLQKVVDTAKELGLEIYPEVASFGSMWPLLAHNPNLAEGTPIKDAIFLVKGRQANVVQSAKLKNNDFEQAEGNKFLGWDSQDGIGQTTFADRNVSHKGKQSLRMENINGECKLTQTIEVKPFHVYHFSWWNKKQDIARAGIGVEILGADDQQLAFPYIGDPSSQGYDRPLPPTMDWTKFEFDFNTFKASSIKLTISVSGGGTGKIWWDDITLEDAGLVNILRRDGCPLIVKGENGTIYQEGRDFKPVSDPRLGKAQIRGRLGGKLTGINEDPSLGNPLVPGFYEVFHKQPTIQLTAKSRIKEGQRLIVSYYDAFPISWHGEINSCFTHPEIYSLVDKQIKTCKEALHPTGFFLGHDEIRNGGNWCALCQDEHMTAGQLLAYNVKRCEEIVRKESPDAKIFVWNDMFDPYHNASNHPWTGKDYYLINGDWYGSWEGLSKDTIILNWNTKTSSMDPKDTLDFFGKRGNPQILCGHYDDPNFAEVMKNWLNVAKDVPNVVGVMYTTWARNYNDLEAFAKALWGDSK